MKLAVLALFGATVVSAVSPPIRTYLAPSAGGGGPAGFGGFGGSNGFSGVPQGFGAGQGSLGAASANNVAFAGQSANQFGAGAAAGGFGVAFSGNGLSPRPGSQIGATGGFGGSQASHFSGSQQNAFDFDSVSNELSDLAASLPGGGVPGEDYPTLSEIPDTGFQCSEQTISGYYADTAKEAGCQVFHICQLSENADARQDSFLCPNGTIFNQQFLVCDWWFNFDCSNAEDFYSVNELVGQPNIGLDSQPIRDSQSTLSGHFSQSQNGFVAGEFQPQHAGFAASSTQFGVGLPAAGQHGAGLPGAGRPGAGQPAAVQPGVGFAGSGNKFGAGQPGAGSSGSGFGTGFDPGLAAGAVGGGAGSGFRPVAGAGAHQDDFASSSSSQIPQVGTGYIPPSNGNGKRPGSSSNGGGRNGGARRPGGGKTKPRTNGNGSRKTTKTKVSGYDF